MEKKVLVPIANGVEEIESVGIIDVLRRAGAIVTVASVGELQVTTTRQVKLVADKRLADCSNEVYDLIAVPGGKLGAENFRNAAELIRLLKKQKEEGRWYAAICASPVVVLQHHGLLQGHQATCHPSLAKELKNAEKAGQAVVVDGNCVTSQGAGTTVAFALQLVELLYGHSKADEIATAMCVGKWK